MACLLLASCSATAALASCAYLLLASLSSFGAYLLLSIGIYCYLYLYPNGIYILILLYSYRYLLLSLPSALTMQSLFLSCILYCIDYCMYYYHPVLTLIAEYRIRVSA